MGWSTSARANALSATADERRLLSTAIGQIDGALDRTRTERVLRIAEQPSQLHLDVLGPIPTSTAGRAVWCHQATELEHHRDYNSGDEGAWRRLIDEFADTPQLAHIAEHHIPVRSLSPNHDTWRQGTQLAMEISETVVEHSPRLTGARTPEIGLELDFGW